MAIRVLVVDDEPDMRLLLGVRFRRMGWEVDAVESGEDARHQGADPGLGPVVPPVLGELLHRQADQQAHHHEHQHHPHKTGPPAHRGARAELGTQHGAGGEQEHGRAERPQ
jgi:hypothetical protein